MTVLRSRGHHSVAAGAGGSGRTKKNETRCMTIMMSTTKTTGGRQERRPAKHGPSSSKKTSTTTLERQAIVVLVLIATVLACCVVRLTYLRLLWSFAPSYSHDGWTGARSEAPSVVRKVTTRSDDSEQTKEKEYARQRSDSASSSSGSEDEPHQELVLDAGENKHHNHPSTINFNDIELLHFLGHGSVSIGFEARLKNGDHNNNKNNETTTFMAKIGFSDRDLHYADTEIEMFRILNAEPTIPNIPKLTMALNRIPNPYKGTPPYITMGLGIKNPHISRTLSKSKEISVIAMELLNPKVWRHPPKTMEELRIFLQSLLSTLEFAHSRNVMMCDLHLNNVYFDGKMVKIFDWNGAFIFEPDKEIILDYSGAPHHLLPPEAKKGNVHRTVSGMDIWTVGLLIGKIIKAHSFTTFEDEGKEDPIFSQVLDLQELMLREDPYERPDATQLLKHDFFFYS